MIPRPEGILLLPDNKTLPTGSGAFRKLMLLNGDWSVLEQPVSTVSYQRPHLDPDMLGESLKANSDSSAESRRGLHLLSPKIVLSVAMDHAPGYLIPILL
jgi:hypothetical protein